MGQEVNKYHHLKAGELLKFTVYLTILMDTHIYLCVQASTVLQSLKPLTPYTLPLCCCSYHITTDSSHWSNFILDRPIQNVFYFPVLLDFSGFSTYLFITASELQYQMDPLLTAARQMAMNDKAKYC